MNTKISALFLLALLSLGVTGFAGAWWTATLKVTGTVTTGNFGMEWSLTSYTITNDTKGIIKGTGVTLADYIGSHPQTLAIDLQHVYPSTGLEIKGDMHYYGTVPGNISSVDFAGLINGSVAITQFPSWVFNEINLTYVSPEITLQKPALTTGSMWVLPHTGMYADGYPVLNLTHIQWHQSYHINFDVYIHWVEAGMYFNDPWGQRWGPVSPGVEVPQDTTLAFTLTFNVVQYNYHP
jgi:hypothetical protein